MIGLLVWAAIGLSLLLFGLWMGFSARSGPQSTLGSAFVLFATILLLAVFWMAVPAHAHDHSRPELDGWYASLRNKHGIPCCDGSDATRVEDADWEAKGGHYRVRLENQWVDVPDEAVIETPNKDGRTLVWPYHINGLPVVRCFMPGSMT